MSKIGKRINGCIYIHRKYGDRFEIVTSRLVGLRASYPDFEYDVLKINQRRSSVTFVRSPDFDTSHEPMVGDSVFVTEDGCRYMRASNDPWVYHHKWMMVDDDYQGFDIAASRTRSATWERLKPDRSRIGKRSYWLNWLRSKGIES